MVESVEEMGKDSLFSDVYTITFLLLFWLRVTIGDPKYVLKSKIDGLQSRVRSFLEEIGPFLYREG